MLTKVIKKTGLPKKKKLTKTLKKETKQTCLKKSSNQTNQSKKKKLKRGGTDGTEAECPDLVLLQFLSLFLLEQ